MPRKKRSEEEIEETETNGEEAQTAVELEEISPEQQDIDALCNDLELAQSTVRVFRRGPGQAKQGYCEQIPMDSFKQEGFEYLKGKYGGGDYTLHFVSEGRVRRVKTISVDPRFKGSLDTATTVAAALPADKTSEKLAEMLSAKGGDIGQLMLAVMQMQQQQSAQMMQMFTALTAAPKSNTLKDVAAAFAPIVPIFQTLLENRAQDSTLKSIEAIARMKQLFVNDNDGGGGDDLGGILKLLAPVVQAKLAAATSVAATATSVAAPAPAPAPQLEENAPDSNDPMFIKSAVIKFVAGQLPALNAAAAKNSDPGSYADVLADQLDEQPAVVVNTFVELISAPDWQKTFFGDATLSNPKWFEDLRAAFCEIYEVTSPTAPANITPIPPPAPGTSVPATAPAEPIKEAKKK